MTQKQSPLLVPNPGSPMAIVNGCACSIFKNHEGGGEPINDGKNRRFYIAADCPIHSDFYERG
jgi:hypothetical protein